jgi:glycosyltransferase involved in cell wall biosynthesis
MTNTLNSGKDDRIRVLFAAPHMGAGGSERVVRTLLQHLDRNIFEPHLALLARSMGGREDIESLQLRQIPSDVEIHSLTVTRARYIVAPLTLLCHRLRPSAILCMSAHLASAVMTARGLFPPGVRVLAREGTDITSSQVTPSPLRRAWYSHCYRRADRVICQSESMRHDMIARFRVAPDKAVRIYNPVDFDEIDEMGRENPYFEPGPNLVVVSRFFPGKRIELILRAMPEIRREFPGARLHLVGWGSSEPALRAETTSLNLDPCVRFYGFQANPYPFLKHADLALHASDAEGLPNVVLEALALGTPVVSTRSCGGLAEIAATTGRLRITDDSTPHAIAEEAILALRKQLKVSSVEPEFIARFSVRSVLTGYENLIQDAVLGCANRVAVSA